jgi:transcriptional regulator with GAF, ATPase, and Fis domain
MGPKTHRGGIAWDILSSGAADVVWWGDYPDASESIAARFARWRAVDDLVDAPLVTQSLVGRSAAWVNLLRRVVEVAKFTNGSVLVTGETGTGKELLARLIHTLDTRPQKRDLVVLDCTTIVPELSGSEFFGHERGAFTGAISAREGAFALADRGTLFLDEVGELSLSLQAQLLRVVQEHTFKPVGSNRWQRTEFRLVCATNKDLQAQIRQGEFRRDLYYRIATVTCAVPPLRERREDIISLTRHFMREVLGATELPPFDEAVQEYLLLREYAGNVRDLRQLASRIAYRHVGSGPFTVGDIPDEERAAADMNPTGWREGGFVDAIRRAIAQGAGLREIRRAAAETAVRIVVNDEQGNLRRAARRLGVSDRALQLRRAADRYGNLGA